MFFCGKGDSNLTEKMYFFDSTEGDERIYNASDFARFHHQIIGDGVSNTKDLPDLEVTAQNNMNVGLGSGYCFANGYLYENTSTLTLTHDTADSNNDRIDRVVIRFDANPEESSIKAVILKGTPANNPVPPALTRDNYIYEMSVAQVRIIKGKSFIEQSQITDERANDAVCGYIPLHNIYRGLEINEHGMVTMPNQSFIKTEKTTEQVIPKDSPYENPYTLDMGGVLEDKQNEVLNNTQIKVKSDGTYSFWVQITIAPNEITVASGLTVYVFVNGVESFPLGSKTFSYVTDRYIMVSGFDSLKKGDVVEFKLTNGDFEKSARVGRARVRIAKIS